MDSFTVYYFDIDNVLMEMADPIKTILDYRAIEYACVRIEKKDWPALKATMPLGTVPVLEVNGKKYAQSEAICRYLGRIFGLAGDNAEEDFEIDQNVAFLADIRLEALEVYEESDEVIKKKKLEALLNDFCPFALGKLDEILQKNNGFMALGRRTWADFFLGGMLEGFMDLIPDIEERCPGLKKHLEVI